MDLFSLILPVLISLCKANLLAIIIVLVFYFVETHSDFKLFVTHFKWKKSVKYARVFRHTFQAYYFLFCCSVLVYDLTINKIGISITAFLIWFVLLASLTGLLGLLHDKYQGVDPNKKEDDLSGI